MLTLHIRVVICPVFPGHVLFFRVKNSVRADFLNLTKVRIFGQMIVYRHYLQIQRFRDFSDVSIFTCGR